MDHVLLFGRCKAPCLSVGCESVSAVRFQDRKEQSLVMAGPGEGPLSGRTFPCRARGSLRKVGLLVGDRVETVYSDASLAAYGSGGGSPGDVLPDCAVSRILPRRNAFGIAYSSG